jgi:RHS repeat-associated protein
VTRSSTVHESWEQSEVLVRQGLAQPWKRTDTHGGFWIIESDSEGKPLRKADEYGLSTEYGYSPTLEVSEVELYDGAGVLIAHGRRDFDGSGRLLSDEVRHFVPGDNGFDSWVKTSYGFDARGSLMWSGVLEEESAPATICIRDNWGRLVSCKSLASHGASGDVVGVEKIYSRNEFGELVGVAVYPEGSATDGGPALTDTTAYDSFGRPVQSTNRLGRTTITEYDQFGHVSAKHDVASNHRTRQTSTIAGRILRTEESDESGTLSDRVMVYEYGPQGFLSRYRLTSGSWTSFQFDEWGRAVEKLLPNGQLETFQYGNEGLLQKHTSGGQVEKTYAYTLGRLTQVGYENVSDASVPAVTKSYEYDSAGDIFALEDSTEGGSSVRLQWQRDSLGQIHSEQTIVDGVLLDHRTYQTTGWGHMESQGFDSLGLEFRYQTDALGRVELVDLAGADVVRCSNHFAGAAQDVELVGVGQLTSAYHGTGLVQRRSAMSASGALIAAESYSWNSAGELVGRSREDQARIEYFEYDAYSRLREWGLGSDGVQGAPLIRWGVDEYNNIRRVDAFSDAYDGGFLVDEVNAIEWFNPLWGPFQYDAVGQEAGRGVGTLGSMSHGWDAAGRPISNTYEVAGSLWSVEWTYDALDRPIRKQTVMTANPDTVGDWVNMYWTDGVVARSEGPEGDRVYLYTGGQSAPVAQYDPSSGQLEGVLSDHQGSVIGVFDSSGMKDAFAYRPYGQAWHDDFSGPITSLPNKQRLLYLARPHDIGTGMVRLGARTYDPFTGRFLSQDPAQEQGGINLYAYAKGNPTSLSDPTGLAPAVGQNSAPSAGNVPTEEELAELGPRDAGLFMGGYDGEPVELNVPSDWSKRDHLEFEFFRGLALMGMDADTVNSYQSLADAGKALQREAFEAALNDLWRSFDVPSREMYEKFGLLEMAVKDPTLALAESHLGAAGLWLLALPETIAYSASYAATGDAIVSTQVETGVGIAAMATGVVGAAKGIGKGVVKLFAKNSGRSAAAASSVGEAATASAAGNAARGGLKWPPNRGFAGKPRSTTLQPGTRIDRYGSEAGTFTSPAGTPFGARSLPPEAAGAPLRGYEVVKPLPVQSGAAAPWFGQPGGGMQYELGQSVKSLVDQGFLRRIP